LGEVLTTPHRKKLSRYETFDKASDLVSVDGRIILKWIFKKWYGVAWTGLIWLRRGTGGGLL
jgi:hypothetical protein